MHSNPIFPPGLSLSEIEREFQQPWFMDVVAWTVALALIGYPIAGLTSAYLGISDNTISTIYHGSIIFLSVLAAATNGLRHGVRGLDPILSLFLLLYTLRLIWDLDRSDLGEAETEMDLLFWLAGVLLPVCAVTLPRSGWNSYNIATALFCVGVTACVAAILLQAKGLSDSADATRLEFEKLNPISLGHMALTTFLVIIAGQRYWRSRSFRLLSLVALFLPAYIMFLANSRGPLVALMGCLVLLVFDRRLRWLVLPMLLLMGATLWFSPSIDNEALLDYFRFSDLGVEESSAWRLHLAAAAATEFLNHPIVGSGSLLPGWGYPHNIVLESGMALGLPGLCLLITLILRTAVRALYSINGHQIVWTLLFFQYLIGAQFTGTLVTSSGVFLFMAYFLGRQTRSAILKAGPTGSLGAPPFGNRLTGQPTACL